MSTATNPAGTSPNPHPAKAALRAVGARARLGGGSRERNWWTAQAASDRSVVLTAAAPFQARGARVYTILDWDSGWRGPCNLLGQGWGDGTFSQTQCDNLLRELQSGEVEVSHRNRVLIDVTETREAQDAEQLDGVQQ